MQNLEMHVVGRASNGSVYVRRPNLPRPVCVAIAICSGLFAFLAFVAFMALAVSAVGGLERDESAYAVLGWILVLGFSLAVALVVGDLAYRSFRWRVESYRGEACLACGYNLAGNESGRCPECGLEIPGWSS